MPTIQDALSAFLTNLGFDTMASEVKSETEPERLALYVKVILKNTKNWSEAAKLKAHLHQLKLI